MTAAAANSEQQRLPNHVAIIMDGNGRWAKSRGLPRTAGHKKGAEALRNLLSECQGLGIHYLTIYAFSSENWNRPQNEISDLMQLLRIYLERELKTLIKHEIRLKIIGDTSLLEPAIRKQISDAESKTAKNSRFQLTVALSYGSRNEITQATQLIAQAVANGTLTPNDISEDTISDYLYTSGLPDPDLLIRTGGEQRLSNFLLWQQAYTELFFTPVFWPDFGIENFKLALEEYTKRERRYGTTA
ncbi:MAG: isoprenyl transferase [Alphaproteobacteria bacterium]|nr:isoprenyl transferase [Alphaproteobacteria bacterium]